MNDATVQDLLVIIGEQTVFLRQAGERIAQLERELAEKAEAAEPESDAPAPST